MQKIAAYCRVSTDKSDQINSLESQKKYFREYISRNPDWELTEIYVDEGISGTSTKKRHSFNKMISDAQSGKLNLILTKEISRFARNTLDSILYTRRLKEWGVGVIFMNDNINTLDSDAELRLTIMASIAQEESRKTSDRVKWGQKRRMEQGVVFGRDMLGYNVRDGKLHINEDGSEIVRLIFHKFVNEGKGTHVIARELREAGYLTATYTKRWSNVVILRVLRNEKYCGDLIQKKTYTPSYLTHDKKVNHGEEEFVIIREHHKPIISRELFERAQLELARRSPDEGQKKMHSNRYCFSGKITCGLCRCTFISRSKKRIDGSRYKSWRCREAAVHGRPRIDAAGNDIGCDTPSLNNDDLQVMMMQIIKNLPIDRQKIVDNLVRIMHSVVNVSARDNDNDKKKLEIRREKLDAKKQRLLDMFLSEEITKSSYRQMLSRYEDESKSIADEKSKSEKPPELKDSPSLMTKDIAQVIERLATGDEWDDIFYRNLLEKIVVHKDYRLNVYLNSLPDSWSYLLLGPAKAKKQWREAANP